jgi:hypothetical protein
VIRSVNIVRELTKFGTKSSDILINISKSLGGMRATSALPIITTPVTGALEEYT